MNSNQTLREYRHEIFQGGVCSVCQESTLNATNYLRCLQCGSTYHVECISRWAAEQDNCPGCRSTRGYSWVELVVHAAEVAGQSPCKECRECSCTMPIPSDMLAVSVGEEELQAVVMGAAEQMPSEAPLTSALPLWQHVPSSSVGSGYFAPAGLSTFEREITGMIIC